MRIKFNNIILEIEKVQLTKYNALVVFDTKGLKYIIAPNVNNLEDSLYNILFKEGKLDISYFKKINNKNIYMDEDFYDSLSEEQKIIL